MDGVPRDLVELKRVQGRARQTRGRRARALEQAREFADQLVAWGATAVWLFGSVLDPDRFTLQSDVDMAVEGLPRERFWQAYRMAMDAPVPVDLLAVEHARPDIRSRILRDGERLATRTDGE